MPPFSALKLEAVCYNPEDLHRHIHRCENLKSQTVYTPNRLRTTADFTLSEVCSLSAHNSLKYAKLFL
jgi:hypothetical protein